MEDGSDFRPRPNLCDPCRSIFAPGTLQFDVKKPHHPNEDSFRQALAMDCGICRQIWGYAGETEYEWSEFFPHGLPLRHLTITAPDRRLMESFELQEVHSPRIAFNLAEKSLSRTNTGHEDVLNLAEYWFQDCLQNHGSSCNSNWQRPWYPTRLLDISTELVRLFTPDLTGIDQPYATISYCWGKEPFFRTTSSNLEQLQTGVMENCFPQVFQDLMKVARRLNIRFLWVDCYCIIQSNEKAESLQLESSSDWLREAANIEKVYENAVLNLGVAHATSPLQNCFQNRENPSEKPLVTEWQPRSSDNESIYLIVSDDSNTKQIEGLFMNPLFERGWVLQERLLCRRMLHFTRTQIYWECSGHLYAGSKDRSFKCESSPTEIETTDDGWDATLLTHYPWSIDGLWRNDQLDLLEDPWIFIANAYAALDLTYPDKDKFFALNGIAKRAASFHSINDVYVAGMFRSSLLLHLRWSASPGFEPGRFQGSRSTIWRAPSWSWLSMDGKAACPVLASLDLVEVAKVLNLSIELSDPQNAFGPLQSASLIIYCRSLTGTVKDGELVDPFPERLGYGFALFSPDDKYELEAFQGEVAIAPIFLATDFLPSSKDEKYPSSAISDGDLRGIRGKFYYNGRMNVWTCLVLYKTQAATYKRLGIATVHEDRDSSRGLKFLDLLIETEGTVLTLI